MSKFRKKIFVAAGYNTTYFGPGRKEFDPRKEMPEFETYLQDAAQGTLSQLPYISIDEGVIGSFMAPRFLNQANLPGFLPFMLPTLNGKPCCAVEGACGTGGKAIAMGMRSILSDLADSVFICGFEVQNTMKSVYGADLLAGAAYYRKERKEGHAFFFPGIFSDRAGAYFEKYGSELPRRAMAFWYQQAIVNARKNPKAQEYENEIKDLFATAMVLPDETKFVPHLNLYHCSKVSDGASSLMLLSEKGLERCGIDRKDAIEIIGIGEAQGDITQKPADLTSFDITAVAVEKVLQFAEISLKEIGLLELHDCFAISALLTLEAIGAVAPGKASKMILDGTTAPDGALPTNLSGGLCGFGHPTGASGVRQMVDLWQQLTLRAPNQVKGEKSCGMMISMGGNDKTVTSFVVKS